MSSTGMGYQLETPSNLIQSLAGAGFAYHSRCFCGGVYREKFRNTDKEWLVVKPRKGNFRFRGSTHPISELQNLLDELAMA